MPTEAVIDRAHGRPRRIVGSVQDVTEWHRAERTIAAHLAVAEALVDWQTFEQGATGLLRNLAAALDCVAGVMWLPEGDVLVAHVIWRSGSTDVSELESVIRQLRLPRGVGLAGQVWESGEPRNVLSLQDDPRFPAEAVAGLRGAVALPALHAQQEVLAVLEFCCEPVSVDVTDRVLRSLTGIGYELGEFLAHRRGELKPLALTPRELEVLQLAAQGCGGREIAERLVLEPGHGQDPLRAHLSEVRRLRSRRRGRQGAARRPDRVAPLGRPVGRPCASDCLRIVAQPVVLAHFEKPSFAVSRDGCRFFDIKAMTSIQPGSFELHETEFQAAVRLQAAFQRLRNAMLIVDDQRRCVIANAPACGLLGINPQDVPWRRIDDFTPAEDRQRLDEQWDAFLENGAIEGWSRLSLPNGSMFPVEFSATANVLPGRHLSVVMPRAGRVSAAMSTAS